ncbi:MAG: O-antigen ligase family protein [Chloroflexi bacterium]|nr:O-antigen ligase family protein [Chloroflexota bacterium]
MRVEAGAWRVGHDEWLAMAALVAAFAVWSAPLPSAVSLAGAVVALALATWRLELAAALAPLTFPLTHQPRLIGALQIAPAEAAVAVLTGALAARVALALLPGRSTPPVRWETPPAWLALPALALLGVATVSLATVADPSHLRESLVEYRKVIVQPLLFATVAWLALRRPRDRWLALMALGVAGAVVGLLAVGQVALGLAGVTAEGVRRAVGVYQHPNNLALFTGRGVALGLALGLTWPRPGGRWLALALAAGAGVGLLASFSRGGWFAVLATAGLLSLLLGRRRLAAGLAAGAAALLIVLPRTGIERLNRLLDSEGGSGALRLDLWRSTLAMLADHPITGVGLDQFLYQYNPRYVAPEAWAERFTAHPHNLPLDFWVRLGLAGLAVGAALHALALAAAIRLVRRASGEARALATGAGALILYGVLHGLVDAGFFLPDLALVFWLAAVVLARGDRSDPALV